MTHLGDIGLVLALVPVACFGYALILYPLMLRVLTWGGRGHRLQTGDPAEWPRVTFSLPVYNEERVIRDTLEALLALDYPHDRLSILVVSDCSSDGTDAIVREFADRGVQLLRLEKRTGKTGAENAAAVVMDCDIVINTDASIRIPPAALKPLIRQFQDPTVGCASGRDIAATRDTERGPDGEIAYTGFEMKLRALESRYLSIVGSSGCFYGIRKSLHTRLFPEALSRDFSSALICAENGMRAVSVDDAICYVPLARSLRVEYRRKVRTMARGLDTLWFKRHLLNPFRYGEFAWLLASHKLVRWMLFLTAPLFLLGGALVAIGHPWLWWPLLTIILALAVGAFVTQTSERRSYPALLRRLAFVVLSFGAGLAAWKQALRGDRNPIWEPTKRS